MTAHPTGAAGFLQRFDGLRARLPGARLPWLQALREAAAEAFRLQGFPTRRVEAWKYTDLRPVADARNVYFVGLDNILRAHDWKNGAQRWTEDLHYRPSSGPLLVGAGIAAAGNVPRVPVFETSQGKKTIQITLETRLPTAPLLIEASPGNPARIAAVTGDLQNRWHLTLIGPAAPIHLGRRRAAR